MASLQASDIFGVEGLVVVITGGGSGESVSIYENSPQELILIGIGLMMAKALEANGAKVYIIGRRLEHLEAAAKQAGDVTKKEDLQSVVDKITAEDGFINVLIANSGITGPTLEGFNKGTTSISEIREFFWKTDNSAFLQTFGVNVAAVFFSIIAFLELLDAGNQKGNVEQKSQVIATSSIGGFNRLPLAGWAYGPSKAAVTHLMKQVGTFFAPHGIRSNIIAPGLYPSDMGSPLIENAKASGALKAMIPLNREGNEQDMAGNILFLTSKAGAYINGNVLLTDGGRLNIVPSTY
ncbi:hypothetical protein HYFRA_00000760 [Hymenoscyphus fraxineus]|uniref:Uncharacterized protein n=1 Tax=Hymenoscyphus fraxineus TaxID=746836 RepID=A0A9N9PGP7_9HELO|nr:hypothetical protein HYFRA_00000760 [Hymenoscyphus fraxineus]